MDGRWECFPGLGSVCVCVLVGGAGDVPVDCDVMESSRHSSEGDERGSFTRLALLLTRKLRQLYTHTHTHMLQ